MLFLFEIEGPTTEAVQKGHQINLAVLL